MGQRSFIRARQSIKQKNGFLGSLIDPIDRLSETVFSILILLTFTMAFRIIRLSGGSASTSSAENMNDLLIGAIGAIIAWGVIDGIMYALISLFERGEKHRFLKDVQNAQTDQAAVEAIADELDFILEPITNENDRANLYQNILGHLRKSQPQRIGFTREDVTSGFGHVLVAILAVLPSLVPILLLRDDQDLAIRISNMVSIVILFIIGYRWGNYTGANPWKTGLLLTSVAIAMVLIAILLGG